MKDTYSKDQKIITLATENFIFYQKSKVIILLGKATSPLISDNKVILDKGENCKIQFKTDILNFDANKFLPAGSIEYLIENTCEERIVAGATVKQFYAKAISNYHENNKRKTFQF